MPHERIEDLLFILLMSPVVLVPLALAVRRRAVFRAAAKQLGLGSWYDWGSYGLSFETRAFRARVTKNGSVLFRPQSGGPAFPIAFDPARTPPESPLLVALLDAETRRQIRALGARFNNDGDLTFSLPSIRRAEAIVRKVREGMALAERLAERMKGPVRPRLADMVAQDPDVPMRLAALKALVGLHVPEADSARLNALKDSSPEVRLVAAVGPPPEESVLEALVQDLSTPEEVRSKAGTALAALRRVRGVAEGGLALTAGGEAGGLSVAAEAGALSLAKKSD